MLKAKLLIPYLVLSLLAILISVSLVSAATEVDTSALRNAVTTEGIKAHLEAFQAFADSNNGTRVAGTAGHDQSAGYVYDALSATGAFDVKYQEFPYDFFQELTPAVVNQTAPGSVSYTYLEDYFTMDYSGSDNVTAPVQAVDLLLPPTGGSTSGCEDSDFSGFTSGNIALIQRGTCTFREKALNAAEAGAVAVIIFNEGNNSERVDLFGGTLGGLLPADQDIPVLSASYAFGITLNDLIDEGLILNIVTNTFSERRITNNVLAETKSGRDDRVVVVGAHLDSVAGGPGIQDNGSGSAAILEIALQMAALDIKPRNKVRFAWWSAEEASLIGSEFYVSTLTARDIKNIAINLNFDMIASPNYARFVYDGDGSNTETAGPNGSKNIEQVFLKYFSDQNLANEPTAFDGRSDYRPFIEVGIPAGGLFTGAEDENPEVGDAYDPCYHLACDTIANVNFTALDEMSDAAAHAVLTFAETTSAVNGTDKGKGNPKWADAMEYRGSHLRK